jgi:hypothetical protein
MPKNLWGDLSALETVRSPKKILLEQAAALTAATKGILVGEVDARDAVGGFFAYDLDITVPTLNNYVYTVLSVRHPLELYPVTVLTSKPPRTVSCSDEQEFETTLETILGSAEVRNVLSRLRSQAS